MKYNEIRQGHQDDLAVYSEYIYIFIYIYKYRCQG